MINQKRINKYINFLNKKDTTTFLHQGVKYYCKKYCPHKGADLSHLKPDFRGVIKCPAHQWEYDVKSGDCIYGEKFTNIRIKIK